MCWILLATQLGVPVSVLKSQSAYSQDLEQVNYTEHWREKKTKSHDVSVINAVALFIAGMVAGAMLKCKRKPPSAQVFLVGMIIYLVGEIMTVSKMKREIQHEIILYEGTRYLDASQKQALLSMVRGYNKYIKAIKQRMGFLMGAFITIQIAAVLAFTEAASKRVTKAQARRAAQRCYNGAPAEGAANPASAPNCIQCQQGAANIIQTLDGEKPKKKEEKKDENKDQNKDQNNQDQNGQDQNQDGQTDQSGEPASDSSSEPAPVDKGNETLVNPNEPMAQPGDAGNSFGDNVEAGGGTQSPYGNEGGGAFDDFLGGDNLLQDKIPSAFVKPKSVSPEIMKQVLQQKDTQQIFALAAKIYNLKPIEFDSKFAGPVSNLKLAPG
jgi:hypothetical protein